VSKYRILVLIADRIFKATPSWFREAAAIVAKNVDLRVLDCPDTSIIDPGIAIP
jgi:hypothetical protein